MEHSSSIVASGESIGKTIVTQSDNIGLKNLKESDTGKAIYVKVYRNGNQQISKGNRSYSIAC